MHLDYITEKSAELLFEAGEDYGSESFWQEMRDITEKVFDEKGILSVYFAVSKDDTDRITLFKENNLHEIDDLAETVAKRYEDAGDDFENYRWFAILKGDSYGVPKSVSGCQVVRLNTIPTLDMGELSFFEGTHDIPFDIKRIYFISKVPEGVMRGFHAHKKLRQLLFCPYGRIELILENKNGRESIVLSDPSVGVIIDIPTWREMLWLQENSVLCVAASDYYEVEDYIRDYDEFKKYL